MIRLDGLRLVSGHLAHRLRLVGAHFVRRPRRLIRSLVAVCTANSCCATGSNNHQQSQQPNPCSHSLDRCQLIHLIGLLWPMKHAVMPERHPKHRSSGSCLQSLGVRAVHLPVLLGQLLLLRLSGSDCLKWPQVGPLQTITPTGPGVPSLRVPLGACGRRGGVSRGSSASACRLCVHRASRCAALGITVRGSAGVPQPDESLPASQRARHSSAQPRMSNTIRARPLAAGGSGDPVEANVRAADDRRRVQRPCRVITAEPVSGSGRSAGHTPLAIDGQHARPIHAVRPPRPHSSSDISPPSLPAASPSPGAAPCIASAWLAPSRVRASLRLAATRLGENENEPV